MMVLATAAADGRPSARAVILRGVDERGLLFYTDAGSPKAADLAANPRAAAAFVWPALERQVRVEGPVQTVADGEADAWFAARPPGYRAAAWAFRQSRSVAAREELEVRLATAAAERDDDDLARPPWLVGYRLRPEVVELWQGRDDRVHDRIRWARAPGGTWTAERLEP
jgi:pyridoxamine 5'-phosphate oxidase